MPANECKICGARRGLVSFTQPMADWPRPDLCPACDKKRPDAYIDTHRLDEDKRIDLIGHAVMDQKKVVSFITDSDPGKLERYLDKLTERFPGLRIIDRLPGPVPGTVAAKVGPPIIRPEDN